jgi:hypothetical protein
MVELHVRGNQEKVISFGFFDTHGKLISPAVVEEIAVAVENLGHTVAVIHCELAETAETDESYRVH